MAFDPTAMIHLYRGELGRMTAYRIRLDTTSNWALGSLVAIVTFVLGHAEVPHTVLILPAILTIVFALIEARRLQDLELIRHRVRILEKGFFAGQLADAVDAEPEHALGDWAPDLKTSLLEPDAPLTMGQAVAVRLQRNYVWLFLTLYGAWWLKLWTTPGSAFVNAAVGPIPGELTVTIASVALLLVCAFAATARPLLPG